MTSVRLALYINRLAGKLPWPLARQLNRLVPRRHGYYFVFLRRPLVVLIPEDFYDDPPHWEPLFQALRLRKVHFLCMVRGAIEASAKAHGERIRQYVAAHRKGYPGHKFTHLANNAAQSALYAAADLPSVFVNQNAYADESVFVVQEDVTKDFDAIYNAYSAAYKRHELAHAVDRLALVTYLRGADSERYLREHAAAMPNARWLNFPSGPPEPATYRSMVPSVLCQQLNRARVGLCLSKVEGAMYASIEYLLCGLPVVTTRSIGGRDVLFDPEHVLTVDDDPRAVAEGVREMLARKLDPHVVRTRALMQMGVHRRRLAGFVAELAARDGFTVDAIAFERETFPQTIYRQRPFDALMDV